MAIQLGYKQENHAHWEEWSENQKGGLRCSNCNARIRYKAAKTHKYCFKCGASMDESQTERV